MEFSIFNTKMHGQVFVTSPSSSARLRTFSSKSKRGHRFGKLSGDGDPCVPNNLLKPGAKEKHQLITGCQATDKKPRPKPTKINSLMSEPS